MSTKCPTKRPSYRDRLAAVKARAKVAKRYAAVGVTLEPQKCEQCPGWHLGQKP